MTIRTLAAAACALMLAGPSFAHEAWADPDGQGGFRIAWGHPGETPGRYDTGLVTYGALFGRDGGLAAFDRIALDDQVVLRPAPHEAAPVLARFVYEPGATIQTSEGRYTRGSKVDHPGYKRAFYSVRSGATLTGWNEAFAQPAGFELEIVPLSDPYRAAGAWRVRLLHDGVPLRDARIVLTRDTGETEVQVSDIQGEAAFDPPADGSYTLSATHEVALSAEPDVDSRRLDTNLHVIRALPGGQ